jgi:hypothetical protein
MNAPVQIRNAEVIRDIRELAERTHLPITEAVGQAVRAEIERLRVDSDADAVERRRKIDEIVARFNALPTVGPMLTDDDLYDELGLPK